MLVKANAVCAVLVNKLAVQRVANNLHAWGLWFAVTRAILARQSPAVLVILRKRRDAGGRVPPLSAQASANDFYRGVGKK